jgi:hypothetical protein
MSTTDFVPTRDAEQTIWLKNFRDKLPTYAKALGWSDAQTKATQKRCDELVASITLNEKKYAEYQAQVVATRSLKESELTALRADARRIKAAVGYTAAIGKDLGIVRTSAMPAAPTAVKARAVAELHPGFVRIKWRKTGCDSVNVYMRRRGETDWRFLGRDTSSPYDDATPLEKPGVIEPREYRVMALRRDQEIGEPSDILSVTFPG